MSDADNAMILWLATVIGAFAAGLGFAHYTTWPALDVQGLGVAATSASIALFFAGLWSTPEPEGDGVESDVDEDEHEVVDDG